MGIDPQAIAVAPVPDDPMGVSTGAQHDAAIEQSWIANADAWTAAVRSGGIASRRLVTDRAVWDAIADRSPARVLDLGCGEGWLTRKLAAAGVQATGMDASAPLIEAARSACAAAEYRVLGFDALVDDPAAAGVDYDLVVANFALLGDPLQPLLSAVRQAALRAGGTLIVQTVHPLSVAAPYADGWRIESFQGFAGNTPWMPMPWYFRTFGSWVALLREAGLQLEQVREPLHPDTGTAASLLLVATRPG